MDLGPNFREVRHYPCLSEAADNHLSPYEVDEGKKNVSKWVPWPGATARLRGLLPFSNRKQEVTNRI